VPAAPPYRRRPNGDTFTSADANTDDANDGDDANTDDASDADDANIYAGDGANTGRNA
jgi:hypothetical protein